jgi:hypothetical protein
MSSSEVVDTSLMATERYGIPVVQSQNLTLELHDVRKREHRRDNSVLGYN